jgi:hypothetical protein
MVFVCVFYLCTVYMPSIKHEENALWTMETRRLWLIIQRIICGPCICFSS